MLKKRTPRDYKFIRLLGEGSFSSVYLAVDADVVVTNKASADSVIDSSGSNHSTKDTSQQRLDNRQVDSSQSAKIRKYAIKVCQKSHIKRQGKQVAIMREKEIMNILNQYPSRHFIRLHCTFQDFERLFFVMSYAENGELLTYMLEHPLSLHSVREFTMQLVEALEHLHKLDIVHRDLKPENILLGEQFNLMISDFGSAQIYKTHPSTEATVPMPNNKLAPSESPLFSPQLSTLTSSSSSSPALASTPTTLNSAPQHNSESNTKLHNSLINANLANLSLCNDRHATQTMSTPITSTTTTNDSVNRRNSFVGTAQYVSPEMLKNRQASNKSDLWALGVIIFQMITNIMPFDAPNEYLIYKKIQSLDYKYPDNFDQSARDLVNSLLKLEPLERLGAKDDFKSEGYKSIRRHAFLTANENECSTPATQSNFTSSDSANNHEFFHDKDLVNLDKIMPGLDETQLLRLLTND